MEVKHIHLFFGALLFAGGPALLADEAEDAGLALATEIRSAQPIHDSEIHGVLMIRSDGNKKDIPVVCKVAVHDSKWETIYETISTNNIPAERLVVIHTTNQPNQYLYAQAPKAGAPVPEPKTLSTTEAARPLAGSDFWISDLGLDFLHWPEQRKLKGEMRIGQPCYVLESRDPNAASVVRIKSFIDKESADSGSPGILLAEAYDKDGHMLKKFSLHGSSFKKVNGQYQLEKMEILTEENKTQKESKTTLKFDLPKE